MARRLLSRVSSLKALLRSHPAVAESQSYFGKSVKFTSSLSPFSDGHVGSNWDVKLSSSCSYSTKIPGSSDTHEDFQPTTKTPYISMDEIVEKDVKENPVLIYMKGYPEAPRCGFSALAVKVLKKYGVPILGRDILEHPQLKESVKAYTNWPTFPQIFIKGEFVGGSDIIHNMHIEGKLKNLLADIGQQSSKDDA